jgi:hypothetical protein
VIVKTLKTALVLVGLGLSFGGQAQASFSPITLVSGNSTPGTVDTKVTYVANPAGNGTFATFNDSTLASATTSAYTVTPNASWTTAISGAQWDSTSATGNGYSYNASVTAIYAITFNVTSLVDPVYISGSFEADNYMNGIYVDHTANQIAGTVTSDPSFNSPTTITNVNISSFLTLGTNTLYFYDVNAPSTGGPAGVLFNLTLTSVPEPSSIVLVGIAGLMGLGFHARRKRAIA